MATRPASASPRRSLSPQRERGALAPIRVHWFYLAAFSAGVLTNMAASAQPAASQEKSPERADRDPLGTAILERLSDPDLETVASKLPPLRKPREIVGVKDHPYEIGVAYDGTIQLPTDEDGWEQKGPTAWFEMGSPPVRLGTGGCKKLLADGYLPVVQTLWQHDGVEYVQTVFGWSESLSPDKDLAAYVWLLAVNRTDQDKMIHVSARLKTSDAETTVLERDFGPVGRQLFRSLFLRIPAPLRGGQPQEITREEWDGRADEVWGAWSKLLAEGMTIEVPEQRVQNAYRAWLAYNFLNVDKKGGRFEPHDGSGFYEAVYGYSAALYCHALDLWGRHADSARYLESLLDMLTPDGLFYVNYGLPDHGALLFALSEHYRLSGDAEWLRTIAPRMQKMAAWLLDARQKALAENDQRTALTRGLIKFAPYADYQNQAFSYYGDAYSCMGLLHAADVLRDIGLTDEAAKLAAAAAAYRNDILASMDAARFERDGLMLLPMEPDTRRLLKDTSYKCKGYYGLIASMMLESELLPPDDPRALLVVRGLERRGGLILGMCEFDGGVDHAYTYGYWLNCLGRNDIRRVLLGFYATLAYGMGRDTYCGVEVTKLLTGEPMPTMPHLYSGTQQLRLLRMMLLHEQGDELVIGPAIPRAWLAAGQHVSVKGAPTRFGPVSFTIETDAIEKQISVRLDPPQRRAPERIRLVVRHPSGKPIRAARIDDEPIGGFTDDTLVLPASGHTICITSDY